MSFYQMPFPAYYFYFCLLNNESPSTSQKQSWFLSSLEKICTIDFYFQNPSMTFSMAFYVTLQTEFLPWVCWVEHSDFALSNMWERSKCQTLLWYQTEVVMLANTSSKCLFPNETTKGRRQTNLPRDGITLKAVEADVQSWSSTVFRSIFLAQFQDSRFPWEFQDSCGFCPWQSSIQSQEKNWR